MGSGHTWATRVAAIILGAAPSSQGLRLYAADAAGELDVFDHDGHALRMDSAEVGVLKQMYHVKLARLLERKERLGLPSLLAVRRRRVIRLRDLSHQPSERQLSNQQLGRSLVLANLASATVPGRKRCGLRGLAAAAAAAPDDAPAAAAGAPAAAPLRCAGPPTRCVWRGMGSREPPARSLNAAVQ
eukprot:CAMPEP_0118829684 /NCGR_PEP_ID=MMETSP1162-20130426/24097_1 /TAXON_ID=33656 /ORGANISM="Phaeocystis Sp, Strain CCMP2710" /LENGTH=185 /DNA_ID=CAMNT_0006760893 /DNA_START=30 /DNA_END=585 /DNA_ORIENTATION=+